VIIDYLRRCLPPLPPASSASFFPPFAFAKLDLPAFGVMANLHFNAAGASVFSDFFHPAPQGFP